jgi:hypothetical protein
MGGRPLSPEELFARSAATGYRKGEHKEEDAEPAPPEYVKTCLDKQICALRRYVM